MAIADIERQNKAYNKRLCHGYNAGAIAAGFEPLDCEDDAEDGTNIDVRGDDNSTQHHHHHYAEKPEQKQAVEQQPSWLGPALGALGAALGAAALTAVLMKSPAQPPPDSTDTQYDFDVAVERGGALANGEVDDDNGT